MAIEEWSWERALARVGRLIVIWGTAGVVAAAVWRGWRSGAGFAVGAAAGWLSFRWLERVVEHLGEKRPARKRVAVLAGLRYLLLGGGAYAILHFSSLSLPAALAGLFVPAAAVISEILIELAYARP